MERKFTDDEIVKALEWCKDANCFGCPFDGEVDCVHKSAQVALDLIKRQKAENSNLTSDLTSLQNDLTSAKAEIERLREEREKLLKECKKCGSKTQKVITKLQKQMRQNKNEAIKGFAERLKQYCAPGGDFGDPCGVLTVTDRWIDHLVKEMTGEHNGN